MFRRYSLVDFIRWLQQRRAMRRHSGGGLPDDPAFFDEHGDPVRYEPYKYMGCLVVVFVVIVIVVFALLFWVCSPFGGDGDDVLIPSPTVSASTSLAPTTTTPPATTTTEAGSDVAAPVADAHRALDIDPAEVRLRVLLDLLGDLFDSESAREVGFTNGEIDIVQMIIYAAAVDRLIVTQAFNESTYECGDDEPLVVCAAVVEPMPEGDILIVAVEHAEPIPSESTEHSYIYSLVFDSDLDPANDWQINLPFDWDLFQGADRWYQAIYSHTDGDWVLSVNQVSEGNEVSDPLPSSVRVVIDGEWVIWFVPSSEIPAFPGRLRATAFGHDGAFTPESRGGDVTGVIPTEPLLDPEAEAEG